MVPLANRSEFHLLHYLAFSLAVSLAVVVSAVQPSALLSNSVITKVGEVSYSMYLVHFATMAPSMCMAEALFPANNTATMLTHFAMTAASTFLISCLTFRYVEKPGVALGARFIRSLNRRSSARADGTSVNYP